MRRRAALCLGAAAFLPTPLLALHVAPNSPCRSVCLENDDDSGSGSISDKEIVCKDSEYDEKKSGQQFQKCMTCLQDSEHEEEDESDQAWFLYNLRYTFSYCVLDYTNETDTDTVVGLGSSPCTTSASCQGLEDALTEGLNTEDPSPFGYCDADDKAMRSDSLTQCLDCIRVGSDYRYLSNYLVALEAGCEQQPAPGILLGLNDTVFSDRIIEITDSPKQSEEAGPENESLALSVPVIAGIAVGGFVVLLFVAGCVFFQCRKRRKQQQQQEFKVISPLKTSKKGGRRHRPASSLSFRCQTHLTPKSPNFPFDAHNDVAEPEKMPAAAKPTTPKFQYWRHEKDYSIDKGEVTWSDEAHRDLVYDRTTHTHHHGGSLSLSTDQPPDLEQPPKMYSPDWKPSSAADEYTTPTSTTSVRSTTALLPAHAAYNPAKYAPAAHNVNIPTQASYPNVTTAYHGQYSQQQQQQWPLTIPTVQVTGPTDEYQTTWGPAQYQQPQQPLNQQDELFFGNVSQTCGTSTQPTRSGSKGSPVSGGSPIESRTLQTSFPPPPGNKRRK